uniref:Uncharacterized protein n=1 Tax=Candidatus Kentrum sp. FW TaxID=2126338 RepID=A0A450S2D8_9GAMM|nr:MAG: hypothetical protein BECKFW1821A_GA0114235_10119 [Candidatus Kentron sp. FW]VFJ46563.1 MAG: hypothetical protein BECKFW1821B_GA0114236_100112 [Candidatus Kentron sp. FW]
MPRAHVVVGFPEEPDGDAMGEEGTEALATGPMGQDMNSETSPQTNEP